MISVVHSVSRPSSLYSCTCLGWLMQQISSRYKSRLSIHLEEKGWIVIWSSFLSWCRPCCFAYITVLCTYTDDDVYLCLSRRYTYLTSTFSECNCAGIQTRFVVCITFMNGAPVRATDQDCTDAGLEQPTDSQPCEAPSTCNPVWRIGAWSPVSIYTDSVSWRSAFESQHKWSLILITDTIALCDIIVTLQLIGGLMKH